MPVQRATFERKVVALSTEWGRKVATEKFGEQLVGSFPTFTRGPRKGLLKGFICWTKCAEGGWTNNVPDQSGRTTGLGGVVKPGTSGWRLTMAHPDADPCGHSIVARWTWCKPEPVVEILQTPQAADQMHTAYGYSPRYG